MLGIIKLLAVDDAKMSASDIKIPSVDASTAVNGALNAAYIVAGIVAVIVMIISGYMIVTGGSNPETVAKARQWILYALIGLIVISIAFAITNFIIGTF